MDIFERLESQVRAYSRAFPAVFTRAKGAMLYDENGSEYIDFFAGAGTLNYGHNNSRINDAIVDYIREDGVIHSLDMLTTAKRQFMDAFDALILRPRNLKYKIQFTGPTGTNAVEAALKLARKVKKRRNVVAFTRGYHGLTGCSLSITGNSYYKNEIYTSSMGAVFMPFDGYLGNNINTAQILRRFLMDSSSGIGIPAAIILETIQAEGGVNVASTEWLQEIERICRDFDILLIVDDIQVGNGRSGDFFSFERAMISPDIVTLSKAIGAGMPLSIVLMKPELDDWKPGEHTGTFRGNNLSFVAAAVALEYWRNGEFSEGIKYKSQLLRSLLEQTQTRFPQQICEIRGYGLIQGIVFPKRGFSRQVSTEAFKKGLVVELAGANDEVLKLLPPLTIDEATLRKGVAIIEESINKASRSLWS